ncbi:hypothetical protein BSKO_02191 [Bryopsis sp. KO-2023]|nr:hypothetical protein BSKO_02191 [Bryopsis sp. KO-2023]
MAGETKGGSWNPSPQRKQRRKEKLLECLNKLGDRDTQRAASEEVKQLIKELDNDGMTVLISNLCISGKEHKPFVRKECVRLFCNLADVECPVRGTVLTHPQITKIVKFLRTCLQDSDGGVREAVGEVFGVLASQWVDHHGTPIPGEPSNLFIKNVLEAVAEPKKDVQVAAGLALGQVAESVGPISKELAKELLKWIKHAHFGGKAQLIAAVCSTENGSVKGFMKKSMTTFKPYLGHFIGQPSVGASNGTGILGLLSSKDWPVRKAAAEAVKTAAVLYGPQFSDPKTGKSLIKKSKDALGSTRFDKVKPVREAILDSIQMLEVLDDFVESDSNPLDWATFWEGRGGDTASPLPSGKLLFGGPRRLHQKLAQFVQHPTKLNKTPNIQQSTNSGLKPNEEIRETESRKGTRGVEKESSRKSIPQGAGECCDQGGEVLGAESRGEPRNAQSSPDSFHSANESMMEEGGASEDELKMGLEGASTPPPNPNENRGKRNDADKSTFVERFRKAAAEVDVIAAPELSQAVPDSSRDEEELDDVVDTPRDDVVHEEEEEEDEDDEEEEDEESSEKLPEESWAVTVDRMEALERQQNRLFEMVEALGNRIDTAVMDLQGNFSSMQQAVCVLQEDMAALIGGVTQRSACVSDFRRGVGCPQATIDPEKQSSSPTLADLDGAYAEALSIPNNELQLIRLIQRTGPVIPELNLGTLNQLLRVFHQFLWEGRALGRILPWFWQLVEPQNREHSNAVDGDTRIKIIGVLSELKREASEEAALQIQSMESSLRAVWDMPAPRDATSKSRYNSAAGRLGQSSRQTFEPGMTDRSGATRDW